MISPRFIWEFVYGLGTDRAWAATEMEHKVNSVCFRMAYSRRMEPWMFAADIIEFVVLIWGTSALLSWGLISLILRIAE